MGRLGIVSRRAFLTVLRLDSQGGREVIPEDEASAIRPDVGVQSVGNGDG